MFGTIFCVAALTLGVEVGWEPNDSGGLEYIIQIDSTQLKHFEKGIPYSSDFPKDLQGLQTIRFQIGEKKLPRIALSPQKPAFPEPTKLAKTQRAAPSPSDAKLPDNPPRKLSADHQTKPLKVAKASFDDPIDSKSPNPKEDSSTQTEPEKPWPLLYGVIALAVGFAAAFMYLAWIHIGMRGRYRLLLAEHLALTQPT